MRVNNALDESTTVHWHGLHVAGPSDGGPHQVIAPGKSWRPSFNIVQEAATLWYHPHPKGQTGRQVYRGLAGFFIIDDDRSLDLNLPNKYGENDIPLVIQDRKFTTDGQLEYETSFIFSRNGMFGDEILVNGEINPTLKVGTAKIRLRVLNGSNTRIYNLSLSDRSNFVQIASDGGFLNRPVKLRSLEISPGERAEIVIDFSKYSVGDSIRLKDPSFDIMQFIVNKRVEDKTTIPTRIGDVKKIPRSAAIRKRTFVLKNAGGGVAKQDLT
ncbi:MAG: multicopper oxidase domain-containing protein, partial [Actinomycetia bacterium]|nr:multicopper oxidase domain-containing protein [Actinomycetes bacterium]